MVTSKYYELNINFIKFKHTMTTEKLYYHRNKTNKDARQNAPTLIKIEDEQMSRSENRDKNYDNEKNDQKQKNKKKHKSFRIDDILFSVSAASNHKCITKFRNPEVHLSEEMIEACSKDKRIQASLTSNMQSDFLDVVSVTGEQKRKQPIHEWSYSWFPFEGHCKDISFGKLVLIHFR